VKVFVMAKILWLRLGSSLEITDEEETAIFGDDERVSAETLKRIIAEGRFKPSGDSYVPAEVVDAFNMRYGSNHNVTDIDFIC